MVGLSSGSTGVGVEGWEVKSFSNVAHELWLRLGYRGEQNKLHAESYRRRSNDQDVDLYNVCSIRPIWFVLRSVETSMCS